MTNVFSTYRPWNDKFSTLYTPIFGASEVTMCKTITFIVTEACNQNCSYCYQINKTDKRMSLEVAKDAVDFILSENLVPYMNHEVTPGIILDFIGGEPLLEIDMISELIKYFKLRAFELDHPWYNKYMLSFSTNGLLFTDPRVQSFILENDGRVSMSITIDGDKEMHDSCRVDLLGNGTYDRVLESINLLKTMMTEMSTKVTIAHENVHLVDKAITHLFDIGIDTVPANCVFEDVWHEGDDIIFFDALIRLGDAMIEKGYIANHNTSLFSTIIGSSLPESDTINWCGGTGSMLAIGVDGTLYPCLRFAPYSLRPETSPLIIGDIYKGIDMENPNLCNLCSITRQSQSTQECLECPISEYCSWCSANNYDIFGTANHRATFICNMHKARVLANVVFWRKVYKFLDMDIEVPCNVRDEDIMRLTKGKGI